MLKVILFACLWATCLAKRVYYDWKLEWVHANPDGFARSVMGINGQWPCPAIDVNIGDTIVVNAYNDLKNQTTALHWHGFHQRGTPEMDGSAGVTQCPIPPGSSFVYEFKADQAGMYWYHAHDQGQYPDGLWGMIIVRGGEPFAGQYDEEVLVTMTDWYHDQMPTLLAKANASVQQPAPDGLLINGKTSESFDMVPGKTYLFRILCASAFSGVGFFFDQHDMTVVEVDGVWTKPYYSGVDQQLRVAPGQRMSALVTAKNQTTTNYGIWEGLDVNMLFFNQYKLPTPGYHMNNTAYLVYNKSAPLPEAPIRHAFNFTDDVDYAAYDGQEILGPVDHQITINITQQNITHQSYTQQRFVMDNETYLPSVVPALYTALSLPKVSYNTSIYGNVHPIYLKYDDVVEIIVNNQHENLHPIHIHGHQFQILERTDVKGGNWTGTPKKAWLKTPVRRDTVMLQNQGYAVIRFRANNPGAWLLHCHVEWHVASGMMATLIEAPERLRPQVTVPFNHVKTCERQGLPWYGNSLGQWKNPTEPQTYFVPEHENGALYPGTANETDHY